MNKTFLFLIISALLLGSVLTVIFYKTTSVEKGDGDKDRQAYNDSMNARAAAETATLKRQDPGTEGTKRNFDFGVKK